MSDDLVNDDSASAPPANAATAEPHSPSGQGGPKIASLTGEILDGNLDRPVEFTDFMFKLGLHYNLPGRPETTMSAPAVSRKPRSRIWLVALAVVVVIAGGAVPILVRPELVTALPGEVLGEWETGDPRYADRTLILAADRVRIDFGDHVAAVEFPVTEVRTRVTAEGVAYEVRYRQESGLTQFHFSFHESTWPPSIQLPHPEGVVWVRSRDMAIIREQARDAEQAKTRGIRRER